MFHPTGEKRERLMSFENLGLNKKYAYASQS